MSLPDINRQFYNLDVSNYLLFSKEHIFYDKQTFKILKWKKYINTPQNDLGCNENIGLQKPFDVDVTYTKLWKNKSIIDEYSVSWQWIDTANTNMKKKYLSFFRTRLSVWYFLSWTHYKPLFVNLSNFVSYHLS